jgi:hypothetical protein
VRVSNCGAGEGWRRSVVNRSCENEVFQRVKEETYILHTTKRRKANWIGHSLRRNCPLENTLLKERWKGRDDEAEDVSSYWMTLRKTECTGNPEERRSYVK